MDYHMILFLIKELHMTTELSRAFLPATKDHRVSCANQMKYMNQKMILGKPSTGHLLRAMAAPPGISISPVATGTTSIRPAAATLEQ